MTVPGPLLLDELAADVDDHARKLGRLQAGADAFAARWRGRLADLEPAELAEALAELDELSSELSALALYPLLLSWTGDERAADAEARSTRPLGEIRNALRFFRLEWGRLSDDVAEGLLAAPELAANAYSLRLLRRKASHSLDETAERALEARRPAAETAWQELRNTLWSSVSVPFDGPDGTREHTLSELSGLRRSGDVELRGRASDAYFEAIVPHTETFARCIDTLVADRLAVDRVRGFPQPMDSTNLESELPQATVENLLGRVAADYGFAQDWFAYKARRFGTERLALADVAAPLGSGRSWTWEETVVEIRAGLASFPALVRDFVDEVLAGMHLDALARPGKIGGAWGIGVSRSVAPYVIVNFTGAPSDPTTLAHELGHAMHFWLAHRSQSHHSAYSDSGVLTRESVAICEVASNMAQLILFGHQLERAATADERETLIADFLDDACINVHLQTVFARFELAAYLARAGGEPLTSERLSELWSAEYAAYYGDTVERTGAFASGWAHIPHFVVFRFNTYGYVFARLAALTLFERFRADPESFMERYVDFLRAGGSRPPRELLAPFGIDIDASDCWDEGFAALAALRAELA